MGMFESKPEWLDGTDNGCFGCELCPYKTDDSDHLKAHKKMYHVEPEDQHMILYMGCDGSIGGRNALNDRVSSKWIDCTGGQAAYEDGDLQQLGDELVAASRETGVKIYHVYRMFDPGLGLDFPMWWVTGGINAGVFQQYALPNDVIPKDDSDDDNNSRSESDTDNNNVNTNAI